ncbi:MAG: hypothetical protein J1F40_05120 [Prevotellaceae bacterium]|nr:hypothetical protein [Prevotellaceae bacterium]
MKKTKITCLILAVAMLTGSCSSSYQASGGVTGAMIGGQVGEAVGYLSGHGPFRGRSAALGNLVGMGVGAVLGIGITSQIEANARDKAQQNKGNGYVPDDEYYSQGYQTGGGAYAGVTNSSSLHLSDLSYTDMTGDGYISKDETIEVEGYITNTSDDTLEDVVIYIDVNDPKHFTISPPLTTTLRPRQRIRYTGRVHCRKARHEHSIAVTLNAKYGSKVSSSGKLNLRTK